MSSWEDTVMSADLVRTSAHKMDIKLDEEDYVTEDINTHDAGWINEMLEYGMSVFLSVAQAQAEISFKAGYKYALCMEGDDVAPYYKKKWGL